MVSNEKLNYTIKSRSIIFVYGISPSEIFLFFFKNEVSKFCAKNVFWQLQMENVSSIKF